MSESEFQGKSHEELYAMVANGKPERLTEVGKTLKDAFNDLDAISKDLKDHVARVKLEGEGGDAFRKWGEQMVMQTTKLAHYTSSAGAVMTKAAEGLAKAQSHMPKPSASPCLVDAEKEKARVAAAEKDRQAAVDAMRLVDSYYKTAGADLGMLEEPRFALPGFTDGINTWERPYESGAPAAAVGAPSVAGTQGPTSGTGTAAHTPSVSHLSPQGGDGSRVVGHASIGGAPVGGSISGTTIDSTGVVSPTESATTTGSPSPAGDTSRGRQADVYLPLGPVGAGRSVPGRPLAAGGDPGAVRGATGTRGPQYGLSVPRGEGFQRPGTSDGIVGGLPNRPGPAAGVPRLPRGTVVGEEGGLVGRGPVGTGSVPGAAASGVVGGYNGSAQRRLLAPGGPVGAAPSAQPAGRSAFTPGGSGLVRDHQSSGMVPHAGAAPASGARRQQTSRPAYLTEDEKTWTRGRRDTVPPVID
ncbi:hypothetical protein GCM10010315_58450 [Streptomyces luteosporeus]|uniref:WXG100 family type VII secretion target n=1 Tax=Streptomyces luteosporeus TaxID=173856 RepID=A0ABN3UAT4_9ACTN